MSSNNSRLTAEILGSVHDGYVKNQFKNNRNVKGGCACKVKNNVKGGCACKVKSNVKGGCACKVKNNVKGGCICNVKNSVKGGCICNDNIYCNLITMTGKERFLKNTSVITPIFSLIF
ncbi:hypothetical protein QN416_08580 [Glaciimonas sp. Cout2]|uniref:hypothetical protein n=1 Tax=Glaciimonas sp. Cout2 TaxID=3048621 RepID=UPI002B231916|nr:hypothetical protein [Glaciimonas sp. Cout2]MEB0011679.1 hypothetical protein [Glaciimonas sp. Cout2]